jgi:phage tail tape-measure protein
MDHDTTRPGGTNLDPITGAPGAHPVGVGLGAAAGGIAAGAAAGTVAAGPVGTVVGAAVGAIAGGLGGKAVAEHFDPTVAEKTAPEHDLRTTTLPLIE